MDSVRLTKEDTLNTIWPNDAESVTVTVNYIDGTKTSVTYDNPVMIQVEYKESE